MCSSVRAIYRIQAGSDAPALARRLVEEELSRLVPRRTLEELERMVSELVTNGIKFGVKDRNERITLDLRVDRQVRGTVIGHGPGFAAGDPVTEASGWGVTVVEWLADRWGVTHAPEGTRVWFETRPS
jgi:two-component sensor histidine kinase